VIGGGFIGSELAASLTTNGKDVIMIFPEETISSRVLPPELGKYMTDYYREKGVNILNGYKVASMTKQGDELALEAKSDAGDQDWEIMVDGVVAGIGAEPNTGLAKKAGLDIDNGVVVNEHLRTSHADIYAAGDIAAFWQPALGGRRRVEHEDNAKKTGRVAGKNMAGGEEVYDYLPLFYSDLFDMGYEAVGDVDTRNEIFADWAEPNRKGVIYYLAEGKVRGVLLWNVWEQVDAARELIKAGAQVTENDLRGRIPMGK